MRKNEKFLIEYAKEKAFDAAVELFGSLSTQMVCEMRLNLKHAPNVYILNHKGLVFCSICWERKKS